VKELAGRETGSHGRCEPALDTGRVQHKGDDVNDDCRDLEQRLDRWARDHREVRMLAVAGLLGKHVMSRCLAVGAMLRGVLMRQAVGHLGKEEDHTC
jgi:hypothetical protein